MAQEMLKHDALLHLLWAVMAADATSDDQKYGNVSSDENAYYEKVRAAEGITISFTEIVEKMKKLLSTIGYDGLINEALKVTKECGKEWQIKVYGYMVMMSIQSHEGRLAPSGEKLDISIKEAALYKRAKEYFGLTDEEAAPEKVGRLINLNL